MSEWDEVEKYETLLQSDRITEVEYKSKIVSILGEEVAKELDNLKIMKRTGLLSEVSFKNQKQQLKKKIIERWAEKSNKNILDGRFLSGWDAFYFSVSFRTFFVAFLFLIINLILGLIFSENNYKSSFFQLSMTQKMPFSVGFFHYLIAFAESSCILTYLMIKARKDVFKTELGHSPYFYWAQIIHVFFILTAPYLALYLTPFYTHLSMVDKAIASLFIYCIQIIVLISYSVHLSFESMYAFLGKTLQKGVLVLNVVGWHILFFVLISLVFFIARIPLLWIAKFILGCIISYPGISLTTYTVTNFIVYLSLSRTGKKIFWLLFFPLIPIIFLYLSLNFPIPFTPFLILGHLLFIILCLSVFILFMSLSFMTHLIAQSAYKISWKRKTIIN